MTSTLKAGLAVSLGVHVFAAAVMHFRVGPPRVAPPAERAVTITMINGVEEPVETVATTEEVEVAALPAPKPGSSEAVFLEPTPPARAPPIESVPEPVAAAPRPTPVSPPLHETASAPSTALPQPEPSASVARPGGDGSAPNPGVNATTRLAPIVVLATPLYRKNPEPPYPAAARRRRQEGVVLLTVTVSASGHAARVDVKQSSGFKLLDDAAAEAVRGWDFEPARTGQIALESEIEVPVRFKLAP